MRVGLTGGIASGKSTVSALLAELGAVVIDADRLAREVVAPGTPGLERIVAAFGPEVLTPAGEMDRPKVGALVFADPELLRTLEGIIHPLVRERGSELEASAPAGSVVVHDIPLLAETGQADRFDAVIVVDVPQATQLERLLRDRAMPREDALARIGAQASREDRRAVATYVIENIGTREDLRDKVAEVFDSLVASGGRTDRR
ncbi:dephospho-CoA kinase [Nocardioides sp. Iso805N]|uniref:dephospho-CoA kinase n=1 Tax=Nocardioides sp. Iso805N TaxID=1283287 RepID=UPI00036DB85E|nr:dephospho-CoA kinase [Nocardioides sp. Iso805N]